jgi:tyrosinase
MLEITRRSFLSGAVALPFATWLERTASAPVTQTLVRYDATSPQGKAMLQSYATAVQRMKSLWEGDPTGWTFQWYIHSPPTSKASEILRIYGASPSSAKALAQASWATCQAHTAPYVEDYFLPWHRAYVMYFESIVRALSGNANFTLPYWNYTVSGPSHGVIPPEFRDPTSALYMSNRNPGVNDGVPIDQGHDPSPINLKAIANCFYDTGDGTGDSGFNPDLDSGLHGSVHVLTGNSRNMGAVPWAAHDPVFWAHHCQIDRLWYSWQRAGRQTPPMSYKFTFANPDGTSSTVDLAQYLDYTTLPYVYDAYVDVPACAPGPPLLAAAQEQPLAVQRQPQPVALGAGDTHVTLTAPPGVQGVVPQAAGARIRALPRERRVYLVLRDLRTNEPPEVIYDVYVQLPAAAAATVAAREYHVGHINFFAAHHPADVGVHHHAPSFRFDITDLARRLADARALDETVTVTFRPAGLRPPQAEARPTVGEVLVVQR